MKKANVGGKLMISDELLGRKPTFFSSDWHISHEKAIEYDKRPFKDINHMHEALIARYNATVPENGHIHSRKDKKISQKILDRQYDVGVPANNYTPVSMSQIESWIAKYGK